jgi:hypothetical protein
MGILLLIFYSNCSPNLSSSDDTNRTTNAPPDFPEAPLPMDVSDVVASDFLPDNLSTKVLSTKTESFAGADFAQEFLKITSNKLADPVYVQLVKGCDFTNDTKCPLVLVAAPYFGIDWSQDPRDTLWAAKDPSHTGVFTDDTDGPHPKELPPDMKVVQFQYHLLETKQTLADTAFFLRNNVSVALVYSRFYLGRNVSNYVHDFLLAYYGLSSGSTSRLTTGSTNSKSRSVSFYGTSLGGFISLHAAALTGYLNLQNSQLPIPKSTVAISPLVDLSLQMNYLDQLSQLLNNNSEKQSWYQTFFNPYLRRIAAVKNNPRWTYSFVKQYIPSPTLIVHDTWDTLIPSTQPELLFPTKEQVSHQTNTFQAVWYQHNQPIDYNTFAGDHAQPSEGLTLQGTWPFAQAFIYNQFLMNNWSNPSIVIPIDFSKLNTAMNLFRDNKKHGQSLLWLKNRFKEFCQIPYYMDINNPSIIYSKENFVVDNLKTLFSIQTPADKACDSLDNQSW